MNRLPGWVAAIAVLGIGIVALPLALGDTAQPPLPSMGIVLGGNARDDTVLPDQPSPAELPAPPTLATDTLTVAEPPRRGGGVNGTSRQPPTDPERPRDVPGELDHVDLYYLGDDDDDPEDEAHEAHEAHEEDCDPGSAGPELPEDMDLTNILGLDKIKPPPRGPGGAATDPCEEPIDDEI